MTMAKEHAAMPPSPAIDIVICTYNRASGLDLMLEDLSRQSCGDRACWRVLVVDNASTDATAEVVTRHRRKALLPDLRYVFEPVPGLTAARLRGARETTAPWIAFVDDDNFLEPTWLEAVARAIRMHGEAGGIGGKVILDWEAKPPRYLNEFSCSLGRTTGSPGSGWRESAGVTGIGWPCAASGTRSAVGLASRPRLPGPALPWDSRAEYGNAKTLRERGAPSYWAPRPCTIAVIANPA